MRKRTWVIAGAAVLALAGAAALTRDMWNPSGAIAQAPQPTPPVRTVPVEVAVGMRKPVPVRIDALGTVSPIASVAIKSRIESEITAVHFSDGAVVRAGDLLFTLDSRTIEAQIRQAEGLLDRDKAQLEAADRDLKRYMELLAKNATTEVNVQNARTQVNIWKAASISNAATLENLRVQLGYCSIRAPISGRISAANVKVGNFVRPADMAPLATINQIAPIYVAFGVPQRMLPAIRQAMAAGTTSVEAIAPGGDGEPSIGRITMIDNTVDPATGMVTIRATMGNADERLWPGTLINTQVTLRMDEAVTVPASAVQTGQSGTYVFVVVQGAAVVRPVTVERTTGGEAVIVKGLNGGETVVTDGQLLLTEGTRVTTRQGKTGS